VAENSRDLLVLDAILAARRGAEGTAAAALR